MSIRVKLLGVRGSMPVHGADYAEFGGATSCILVEAGGEAFILDAGTGLHAQALRAFFPGKRYTLLISHPHVDHMMGFPAFSPLFDPACAFDIYLKARDGLCARAQIERLMAPPLWPVRTDVLRAQIRYFDVPERFYIGDALVETMELPHPGGCTAYKITHGHTSVVYATDAEPVSDAPEDLIAFARGCSLLLLDGQYLTEEYARTKGFGHSTVDRSAAIAAACGAQRTLLIHHDPSRTDAQLRALEERLTKSYPGVRFGRAGEEVSL